MLDLTPLVAGLIYPSEDDRPVEAVDWPAGPASAAAAVAAHVPAGATAEPHPPAAFFRPLRATAAAARFAALDHALSAHLTGVAFVRVTDGSAAVRLFVVGRTSTGRWAGVRTVSVET